MKLTLDSVLRLKKVTGYIVVVAECLSPLVRLELLHWYNAHGTYILDVDLTGISLPRDPDHYEYPGRGRSRLSSFGSEHRPVGSQGNNLAPCRAAASAGSRDSYSCIESRHIDENETSVERRVCCGSQSEHGPADAMKRTDGRPRVKKRGEFHLIHSTKAFIRKLLLPGLVQAQGRDDYELRQVRIEISDGFFELALARQQTREIAVTFEQAYSFNGALALFLLVLLLTHVIEDQTGRPHAIVRCRCTDESEFDRPGKGKHWKGLPRRQI